MPRFIFRRKTQEEINNEFAAALKAFDEAKQDFIVQYTSPDIDESLDLESSPVSPTQQESISTDDGFNARNNPALKLFICFTAAQLNSIRIQIENIVQEKRCPHLKQFMTRTLNTITAALRNPTDAVKNIALMEIGFEMSLKGNIVKGLGTPLMGLGAGLSIIGAIVLATGAGLGPGLALIGLGLLMIFLSRIKDPVLDHHSEFKHELNQEIDTRKSIAENIQNGRTALLFT